MKLMEETVAIINPFIKIVESLLDRIIVLQISQLHESKLPVIKKSYKEEGKIWLIFKLYLIFTYNDIHVLLLCICCIVLAN